MISTKNNSPQPKTMTWARALPILSISIVFDSLRLMFSMFWFFGPMLAGIATNEALGGGVVGKIVGTAVAGATGFFGGGMSEIFGIIIAMAVGLAGWLTVGLLLILTNARIFKENIGGALRFAFGLLISEIPIVGGLPALTGITGSMYYSQIKKEKAALKKWKKEQSAKQIQERNLQAAQFMQIRAARQAQAMQQEAANDETYAQQAANDEKYGDEEVHKGWRNAA